VATKTLVTYAINSAPSSVFAQSYLYWINQTHVPSGVYSCAIFRYRIKPPGGPEQQIYPETIQPHMFNHNVTEVVYYANAFSGTCAAMFDYEYWA
jgi:hypothetical protein